VGAGAGAAAGADVVRRGEIWLVDFHPPVGNEIGKLRPAVVVSNDGANISVDRHGHGVVTVVPLTSNVRRVLSFQVLLPAGQGGLLKDSKVQIEQVRCVSPRRVGRQVGRLSSSQMAKVDAALRLHLALD
jgi:mRNA interferase MazF